ncbi:hypothetical protein [Singulisphaera acidiphila]|uniref:hypothetical protein n=1 Tax=Singulisphaera acidiphila TaxID=466153 RepID=UPI0012B55C35|nr:hypothetical protein [Singulisphaera acidiphila]
MMKPLPGIPFPKKVKGMGGFPRLFFICGRQPSSFFELVSLGRLLKGRRCAGAPDLFSISQRSLFVRLARVSRPIRGCRALLGFAGGIDGLSNEFLRLSGDPVSGKLSFDLSSPQKDHRFLIVIKS